MMDLLVSGWRGMLQFKYWNASVRQMWRIGLPGCHERVARQPFIEPEAASPAAHGRPARAACAGCGLCGSSNAYASPGGQRRRLHHGWRVTAWLYCEYCWIFWGCQIAWSQRKRQELRIL